MRTLILSLSILAILIPAVSAQTNDRIEINSEPTFASGSNIAWINFASDIGPGETRLDLFEEMFKEINENGGNMMRIWLHTNGTSTPEFNGMDVVGPGEGAIDDLREILDLAYFYDVSLLLCLWSFDMLQTGQMSNLQRDRNLGLLNDTDQLQTYIDNALIPMVDSLKSHPAIGAWEIFNEPEGMSSQFGWTPVKVNMSSIQRFINRTAGAIKRTDPNALVTNGSWNIRASSDIGSWTNYYRDDRLINAGGDEDGVLDFYGLHYYKHFPTSQSPFHNDASHWGLDKPIVVGEFYLSDPRQDGDPDSTYGVHWSDLYQELYNRGYAGALGWQWFDWWAERTDMDGVDGTLSWPRMLENMDTMRELYPEDVLISFPGIRLNFNAFPGGIEEGGSSTLSWEVRGAETVTLNGNPVNPIDSLDVSPTETTTYTLLATDSEGATDEQSVTITVLDPEAVNRAFEQPTTASTVENDGHLAKYATDGNPSTRWSSQYANNEWLSVDLGKAYDIHNIKLLWEDAYAASYTIDVSYDGFSWRTVFEETNGDGQLDSLFFDQPEPARFVRMNGIDRATEWGFSLYELEVYGLESDLQPPQITLTSPNENSTLEAGRESVLSADIIPGSGENLTVSFFIDDEQLQQLSPDGDAATYSWTPTESGTYTFHAVAEDNQFEIRSSDVTVDVLPEAEFIRLEAEDSELTGDTQILTDSGASSGEFVRIEEDGSYTWNGINVNEAGNYPLEIRFRLPFDSPKSQFFYVNNTEVGEIEFSGELNTWLTERFNVDLVSGENSIRIESSWGYMDFDYVELRGQNLLTSNQPDERISEFKLGQNYPNPFNPSTVIPFTLAERSDVSLDVFDVTGRRIATLVSETMPAGTHNIQFNASGISSGIYFYRIKADQFSSVQRMVLVK